MLCFRLGSATLNVALGEGDLVRTLRQILHASGAQETIAGDMTHFLSETQICSSVDSSVAHIGLVTGFPLDCAEALVEFDSGRYAAVITVFELHCVPSIMAVTANGIHCASKSVLAAGREAAAFTMRQRSILKLLAGGCCTREIGKACAVSSATVKRELRAISIELGTKSRSELVSHATALAGSR